MKNMMWITPLAIVMLLLATAPSMAETASSGMNVSVGVATAASWSGSFDGVTLTAFSLPADQPESSSIQTFITNGDVTITADNSPAARLTDGDKTLTTEYKLAFDSDGTSTETGAPDTAYEDFSTFLTTPAAITCQQTDADGGVAITMHVRASGNGTTLPESGNYTATQTLTVSW